MQSGEGWQAYYERSRRIISGVQRNTFSPCLVHRILKAYLREAWNEKVRRDRDQGNRTEALRHYRSRRWWLAIDGTPLHIRRFAGWVHARPGVPLRQREDLLVDFRGERWREWRDSMPDMTAWERSSHDFINEVCAAWQLPMLPTPRNQRERMDCQDKLPPHWPEHELPHAEDNRWQPSGNRFAFIMDSQTAQRIVCGHSALANEAYRIVFQRIMGRLVKFIKQGLLPPRDLIDGAGKALRYEGR